MDHIPLNQDQNPKNLVRDLYNASEAAFNAQELDQADKDLTRILTLPQACQADIVEALILRGSVRMASNNPGDAVEDWTAVLTLEPNNEAAVGHLFGGGEHVPPSPLPGMTPLTPVLENSPLGRHSSVFSDSSGSQPSHARSSSKAPRRLSARVSSFFGKKDKEQGKR